MKTETKTAEEVANLKKDFTGSNDYLSGVNDGMYHLARKLQVEKVIPLNLKDFENE